MSHDEPDESALYNAEVAARHDAKRRQAVVEHDIILMRYAEYQKRVQRYGETSTAEELNDIRAHRMVWDYNYGHYNLALAWPEELLVRAAAPDDLADE